MKRLRYDNRPNGAGFVDLTLRLGLPNHDYYNNNIPININQSLNFDIFNPQQASLTYSNGPRMSSTSTHVDQPSMPYWQYGDHNNTTGNINNHNNMVINNITGGPNKFGGFNQAGMTTMGQNIINTKADQVLRSVNNSNGTRSRSSQLSSARKNNRAKKQRTDSDHHDRTTLCNACGIKYRKQQEKRAAATKLGNNGGTSNIDNFILRE
ncbi:hypothetical protein TIFTF001_001377 [Ficus carica]|uniref:GATA-type domain-containing protein n=1 Tax=Ficus carica TaxID=3494 RepID=A0AA88CRI8_FICCA|nr:hypothetical protein TIFTF001_001377 [Ficus carica]